MIWLISSLCYVFFGWSSVFVCDKIIKRVKVYPTGQWAITLTT